MPQPQMYPQQAPPPGQMNQPSAIPASLAYQPHGVPTTQFSSPGKRRYLHSTRTQSPCRVRKDLMSSQMGSSSAPVVDLTAETSVSQSAGPGFHNTSVNPSRQYGQSSVPPGVQGGMPPCGQNMGPNRGPNMSYPPDQMSGQYMQNSQPTVPPGPQQQQQWNNSNSNISHSVPEPGAMSMQPNMGIPGTGQVMPNSQTVNMPRQGMNSMSGQTINSVPGQDMNSVPGQVVNNPGGQMMSSMPMPSINNMPGTNMNSMRSG